MRKYSMYQITIEDIGTNDGSCYGKWSFRSKYIIAKLKHLLPIYEGYNIRIYSCSSHSVIYEGTFGHDTIEYFEEH